jgi:hypothetical protein
VRGTRARLQGAKSILLHQQGPLQLRDPLQSGTKATLRHLDYEAQAPTLYRESSDLYGTLLEAQGNYREPSLHGKDRQVSTRAHGARHNLCSPNDNQVLGHGKFCG